MATHCQSQSGKKRSIFRLQLIGSRFLSVIIRVPVIIDWLVRLISGLVILAFIVFGVYAVYSLVFGGESSQNRIVQLLDIMNRDWKAMTAIIAVLFYNPIRAFLGRMERFIVKAGPVELQASQKGPSTMGPPQPQIQAPLPPPANHPTGGAIQP